MLNIKRGNTASGYMQQRIAVDFWNGRTDEDLLELYLALPKKERDVEFIDTTQASEICGLARRTVQMWIEMGYIRAIRIGKKYRVYTTSLHEHLRRGISAGCE